MPGETGRDLIARIDERTKSLQEDLKSFRDNVDDKFDDIYTSMDKHYTKKGDFDPVKKLVYGFVGFILLSVGGMFIAMLIRSYNLPMETAFHVTPSIVKPQPTPGAN